MVTVKMTKKELQYAEIISLTEQKNIKQTQASDILGISLRQVKRLCKRFRTQGIIGLVHKSRGVASNNKISDEKRDEILNLITSKYSDFTPQLICEQLCERHQILASSEWIRLAMIKKGLWEPNKIKQIKTHQRRKRRKRKGELVQIDGSYHKWLEDRGPKCCLLVAIDDATSELLELRFEPHETTEGYMNIMKSYIRRRGRPIALYSDRLNIFTGKNCQFGRALRELDIGLINANSPQAKGRVERANNTLQDRLIKLMRLEGICTIEAANEYLELYRADHNKRFARKPNEPQDAHRSLSKGIELDKVLSIKETRKVSKDLSVRFNNKTYCLKIKNNKNRMYKKTAQVYEIFGKVYIEVDGKEYNYTIYEEQIHQNKPMNRKELDAWLDRKPRQTEIQRIRLSRRGV